MILGTLLAVHLLNLFILTSPQSTSSRSGCITFCQNAHRSVFDACASTGFWCPYWSYECPCYDSNCPGLVSCSFSGTSRDCNVDVESDAVPAGASVPGSPVPGPGSRPTSSSSFGSTGVPGLSGSTSFPTPTFTDFISPLSTEKRPASVITAVVVILVIIIAVIGSLISSKVLSSPTAVSEVKEEVAVGGHGATVEVAVGEHGATVGGQEVPFVGGTFVQSADPVMLLLHFQFMSTSGFLSLAYPENYLGFTLNFAWANFLIPSPGLKKGALRMVDLAKCLSVGADGLTSGEGFDVLAARYGVPPQALGGIVYLSVLSGIAIALLFTASVTATLALLERALRGSSRHETIKRLYERWPSIASNFTLRLFVWVLGSVSTFTFYQFTQSCARTPLAVSILELLFILSTLFTVSVLIVSVARRTNGLDVLFPLPDSEPSKYARRWGSLYMNLKPKVYWFFIQTYWWVIARSAVVGFGQDHGLAQVVVSLLLEVWTMLSLLYMRPYATKGSNILHCIDSATRLLSNGLLISFINQVVSSGSPPVAIGVVLICIQSIFALVLFVLLLIKFGAAIINWRRNERC